MLGRQGTPHSPVFREPQHSMAPFTTLRLPYNVSPLRAPYLSSEMLSPMDWDHFWGCGAGGNLRKCFRQYPHAGTVPGALHRLLLPLPTAEQEGLRILTL